MWVFINTPNFSFVFFNKEKGKFEKICDCIVGKELSFFEGINFEIIKDNYFMMKYDIDGSKCFFKVTENLDIIKLYQLIDIEYIYSGCPCGDCFSFSNFIEREKINSYIYENKEYDININEANENYEIDDINEMDQNYESDEINEINEIDEINEINKLKTKNNQMS